MHAIYVCIYGCGGIDDHHVKYNMHSMAYGDSAHSYVPGHSNSANCKFTLMQSSKINQQYAGTKTSS